MPTLLAAADLLEAGTTVVVAGQSPFADPLVVAALRAPDPATVVLRQTSAQALPADHPAFGKTAPPGGAVAYVCRGSVCGLPLADPAALSRTLLTRN
jgi:uncharacterized protein YyaL (SSP411 family)